MYKLKIFIVTNYDNIFIVEVTESILEGSFYEIDHSKLLPGTPATLRSVRAVMVLKLHPDLQFLFFCTVFSYGFLRWKNIGI